MYTCDLPIVLFRTSHKPSSSLLFYHIEGFPFSYSARSFNFNSSTEIEIVNALLDLVASVL